MHTAQEIREAERGPEKIKRASGIGKRRGRGRERGISDVKGKV